jgi:hypothetical protein
MFILNLEIIKVYGMGSRVKSVPLLLLALFLSLLLLLQAGCLGRSGSPDGTEGGLSSAPVSTTLPGGEAIQDGTPRFVPKVSLSTALGALPAAGQEGSIRTGGMALTKVWGYGVDSSGLARTWILGMQGGGRSALFTFNEGEFEELDLPAALPQGEVKMGEILSPNDLFGKQMNTIVREMNNLRVGECDLVLDENSYQVIIHSPTDSRTLSFNPKTGELMASP